MKQATLFESTARTVTLRCPVCGYTVRNVLARQPIGTCPHAGTIHDAKRAAVMTEVEQEPA